MVEWMVVWADPDDRAYPFMDGVEEDTASLCSELDDGVFVLGGIRYRLVWLEEPERSRVLADVFGLPDR